MNFYKVVIWKRKQYFIDYRWVIDGYATGWGVYKVFRKRSLRDNYLKKLIENAEYNYVQYKAR